MSKPTAPTPLEDTTVIYNDSNGKSPEAYLRLRAFLQSPAVQALADPALGADAASFCEAAANPGGSDFTLALGFAMAELAGEEDDALNQLIWEGNPPEPWGTVADKYHQAASELFTCALCHLREIQKAWDAAAQAMSAEQRSCEAAKAQEAKPTVEQADGEVGK